MTGSNRRPSRCTRDALPTELTAYGREVRDLAYPGRVNAGESQGEGTIWPPSHCPTVYAPARSPQRRPTSRQDPAMRAQTRSGACSETLCSMHSFQCVGGGRTERFTMRKSLILAAAAAMTLTAAPAYAQRPRTTQSHRRLPRHAVRRPHGATTSTRASGQPEKAAEPAGHSKPV